MRKESLSKKNITIICALLALLLLLGVAVCIVAVVNTDEGNPHDETTLPTQTQESTEASDEPTVESTAPTETEDATEPSQDVVIELPPYAPVTPTQPTTPPKTVLYLPYTIPGTNLVVQRIAPYSGMFLEDGSNDSVTDVAMILLYNGGTEAVEYANITMVYDYGTLKFTASAIPAGGQAAVQEINRSGLVGGSLLSCTAEAATMPGMELQQDRIRLVDNGDNSLTVTNLTDTDIVTVRIFYKYYYKDQAAFVGGITYTAKLSNLKAGESVTITPSHYASNGSAVVMVRTYDTDA